MDKEELLKEITKTEEHLAALKKMLKDCAYSQWKPKEGETYYSISEIGSVIKNREWLGTKVVTETRRDFYNIFQTKEQAENEAEKILVRRQLEDIARHLNGDRKIDWFNDDQYKYSLHINFFLNKICITYNIYNKEQGAVYCLDKSFLDVALEVIGQERLENYLKGE